MPGPFRFQYIFAVGQQGDSETWYSNVNTTLQDASNNFALTVPSRNAMLGFPAYIQAQRSTDLSNPRSSIVRTFRSPWNPGVAPPAITRDTSWNAISVRLQDRTGQYRRTMEIRGAPDDWIAFTATGDPAISDNFSKAFKVWLAAASAVRLPLSWKALPKRALGPPQQPITAILFPPANANLQITCPNHGLTLNQTVGIFGCRGRSLTGLPPQKQGVNGKHVVNSVIDANNFTIELTSGQFETDVAVYLFGGIRPTPFSLVPNPAPGSLNWQYPVIETFDPLAFSRRQAGRPFFLPRGHRLRIPRG